MSASPCSLLLEQFDRAYDARSWHGPNLRGALRGVGAREALVRVASGRRNINEQALHAAYWKYVAWRSLTGSPRGRFPGGGSNWIVRDGPAAANRWRDDLVILETCHRQLREIVAALAPADLARRPIGARAGSSLTVLGLVMGIAAHDLYHAGQISLLRRLVQFPPTPASKSRR